jgi:uncharacterized protein (TIGR02271 family)
VTDFAEIELGKEDVEIERVPFETVVDAVPQVRVEGDVTIVPIIEERLVVQKCLVLVEEIQIRRRNTIHTERVETELRKQTASVERINADDLAKEN